MPLPLRIGSLLGTVAALVLATPTSTASAQTVLTSLTGTWSGGGSVHLADGRSERLSCRAYYTTRDGGAGLGVALRCASQSYKIELRSSLQLAGGRVSGTWEERSFNANGAMSGTASGSGLNLSFNGTMAGSMTVALAGNSQRVSIRTDGGGGLASVSLNLSKG